MSKRYFASMLLTLLISVHSGASDYLLRVETAELRVRPNGAQETDSSTRETFEILVHSGKAFFGRTQNGTNKVLVNGKLEEASDGKFLAQVNYRKSSASGETIPAVNGQRLPVLNAIEMKTDVITVELGKEVEVDFDVSRSKKIRAKLSISIPRKSRNKRQNHTPRNNLAITDAAERSPNWLATLVALVQSPSAIQMMDCVSSQKGKAAPLALAHF